MTDPEQKFPHIREEARKKTAQNGPLRLKSSEDAGEGLVDKSKEQREKILDDIEHSLANAKDHKIILNLWYNRRTKYGFENRYKAEIDGHKMYITIFQHPNSSPNGGIRAAGRGWQYEGAHTNVEDFINAALLEQEKIEGPIRLKRELEETREITRMRKLTYRYEYRYQEKRTTIDRRGRVKSVKRVTVVPKYPDNTYELSIQVKNKEGKTIRAKMIIIIGYKGYHRVPPISFTVDIKNYPPQYKTVQEIIEEAKKMAE